MKQTNDSTFNGLRLKRYPAYKHRNLRAWDAADDYLIKTINDYNTINEDNNVLVFNDSFGALTLSIQKYHSVKSLTIVNDSINGISGLLKNAKNNDIEINLVNIINSLYDFDKQFSHVLIKSPKSIDALVFFLTKIQNNINTDSVILIAGMVKHFPKNLWKTLEDKFGYTHTSLAKKKAKIITLNIEKFNTATDYPVTYKHEGFTLYNHASVFSKKSLDIGTRFLLDNMPVFKNKNKIIDLGCGNGVLGLYLTSIYPKAEITLTDESYMAIESAKLSIKNNLEDVSNVRFLVNNCLDNFPSNSYDLIVCNPPFHQSHTLGIQTALIMFKQSHKSLIKNGHLIIIANRHLPYYSHLKRIFNHVETYASNKKFNIYLAKK